MKAGLNRRALGVFILITVALAAGAATTTTVKTTLAGGPPTITMGAAKLNPTGGSCTGTEIDCVRVIWTATVPAGTTVNGWTVELTTSPAPPSGPVTVTKQVPAAARQADLGVFHTLELTGYHATVTANYSSSASANGTGSF